ncbi:MAG: UTP--glucose-1-phosphate uridylyltransferase [Candidatus Poribacteria bacterium]|nr:UTP--glucose-1-phosphate uridylyltransferase [Candidatus Poribacteria bacterium]
MSCLKLAIQSGRRVKKAVIPAAGFGTRLFPASKAVKKELFPIIDRQGRAKPVIMAIVEEAISAGIEEVCLIVQNSDRRLFEEFFSAPPPVENFNKLSRADQEYCRYLLDLGHRITLVTQDVQEGFGHAVFCAREWVGNEPFLLMLGDHLYASNSETPCARQLLDVYDRAGHSVVGLKTTPASEIHKFGCVNGIWQEHGSLLSVTAFHEKPDIDYAREHLHVEGLETNQFLTLFGQYVITPNIFHYLEEHIAHNVRERGEFQLTSCLDKLRQEEGFSGYLVKGKCFDIGVPEAYRKSMNALQAAYQ